jgi:hypothetical protein
VRCTGPRIWRERFLIILHALQSALVEPPTICCPCDLTHLYEGDSTLRPCPFGAQRCGRARWVLNAAVVPVGSSKREEMHIMNASATSRRMSGAQQQAGLLRARLVRQSEYASKGSTSIAT